MHTLLFAVTGILLGFQGVVFAFCARVYAFNEKLLLEIALERFMDSFTLESGVIAGGVLYGVGLLGAMYAVARWWSAGFGPLNPSVTLRIAIPSAGAMCLGGQVVLTASSSASGSAAVKRLLTRAFAPDSTASRTYSIEPSMRHKNGILSAFVEAVRCRRRRRSAGPCAGLRPTVHLLRLVGFLRVGKDVLTAISSPMAGRRAVSSRTEPLGERSSVRPACNRSTSHSFG